MNRREFCLTSGLLLAASVCCGGLLPRKSGQTVQFRAKKIFPAEIVWEDSGFVHKRLEEVCRNGCNGLLLMPGHHSVPTRMERIKTEAKRFGLNVFVPVRLTSRFFQKVQTAVPLEHEAGMLQRLDGKPADDGGLLLLDGLNNVLGLVLYDSSRCHWTGFAVSDTGFVQEWERNEKASQLAAARWMDHFSQCLASVPAKGRLPTAGRHELDFVTIRQQRKLFFRWASNMWEFAQKQLQWK